MPKADYVDVPDWPEEPTREELLKARRAATVVYNYIAPGMEPFLWRDLEGIVSREEMQEWRDWIDKRDE